MDTLEVLFYDGQSSVGRKAYLTFKPGFWEIQIVSREDVSHTSWDITQISRAEILGDRIIFRYGRFPQQVIEGNRISLGAAVNLNYPAGAFFKEDILSVKGWKSLSIAAAFFVALLAGLYFFVLPPVAGFVAEQIPRGVEEDLGNSMLNSFIGDAERDTLLTAELNSFADLIDFKTDYDIRITVVKNSEVNAFALPGGNIVVYDGILKKMQSPEELAALLSHEVAHVQYKHSLNSLSQSLSRYFLVSLILNDINGISSVLIDNANMLGNLSFSRSLESEADDRALETLESNGINQQGMVKLFHALKSEEELGYLKFISTHPLTSERIEKARKQAKGQKIIEKHAELEASWKKIKDKLKQ